MNDIATHFLKQAEEADFAKFIIKYMIVNYPQEPAKVGKMGWAIHDSMLLHRADHALLGYFFRFCNSAAETGELLPFYQRARLWAEKNLLEGTTVEGLQLAARVDSGEVLRRDKFEMFSGAAEAAGSENFAREVRTAAGKDQTYDIFSCDNHPRRISVEDLLMAFLSLRAKAIRRLDGSAKSVRLPISMSTQLSEHPGTPSPSTAEHAKRPMLGTKLSLKLNKGSSSTGNRTEKRKRPVPSYLDATDELVVPSRERFFDIRVEDRVIAKLEERVAELSKVVTGFDWDKRMLMHKIAGLAQTNAKLKRENEGLRGRVTSTVNGAGENKGGSFGAMLLKARVKRKAAKGPAQARGEEKADGGKIDPVPAKPAERASTTPEGKVEPLQGKAGVEKAEERKSASAVAEESLPPPPPAAIESPGPENKAVPAAESGKVAVAANV